MDLAECCRQADSDVQDAGQIERSVSLVSLKNQIQGLTARIFEYKDCPPFVTSEFQRLSCPRGIEFGCERVFVFEPPETLRLTDVPRRVPIARTGDGLPCCRPR